MSTIDQYGVRVPWLGKALQNVGVKHYIYKDEPRTEEDFKAKVATIKESYFGAKKEASSDIDDVAVGESTENVDLSKSMAAYTAAITKTKDIKLSK